MRKTADGYTLRYAGERVVRAVLAGTITADPTIEVERTDERCLYCGSPVEMAYEEETISLRCTACGGVVDRGFPAVTYMHYEFPPAGLLDRTREAAIDADHVHWDAKFAPMAKGVCPECAAPIDVDHEVCEVHTTGDDGLCPTCESRFEVWTTLTCTNCRYSRQTVLWFAVFSRPDVVAFLHEHGLEERVPIRKLTWRNARFVRDVSGTVDGRDPLRFRVTIEVEEERLEVTLDADLEVLELVRAGG